MYLRELRVNTLSLLPSCHSLLGKEGKTEAWTTEGYGKVHTKGPEVCRFVKTQISGLPHWSFYSMELGWSPTARHWKHLEIKIY